MQNEAAGSDAKAMFDNNQQSAADVQAKAGAAYGTYARWKVQENGKYADRDGNLTLMVKGRGDDGKVKETPILVKKDAATGRYDLVAAVQPVTALLLAGNLPAAKAKAVALAATPSPAEVVKEISRAPVKALLGPALLGIGATTSLKPQAPPRGPAPQVGDHCAQRAAAQAAQLQALAAADKCEGKGDCPAFAAATQKAQALSTAALKPLVPAEVLAGQAAAKIPAPAAAEHAHAQAIAPVKPVAAAAIEPAAPTAHNAACLEVFSMTANQRFLIQNTTEKDLPSWVKAPPHFVQEADGQYAVAVDCVKMNRSMARGFSQNRARVQLARLVQCAPAGPVSAELHGSRPTETAEFKLKESNIPGTCSEVKMKIGA